MNLDARIFVHWQSDSKQLNALDISYIVYFQYQLLSQDIAM